MTVEIHDRDTLIAWIRREGHLRDVVVQELDLRGDGAVLRSVSGAGAAFLGCTLDPDTVVHLYRSGADLMPPLTASLPFRPYRHGPRFRSGPCCAR
jgi:hypothetical protein